VSDSAPAHISLPDLAVLRCQGADAVTFLHNQLSNDIAGLPASQACMAAYCSPKGRVLTTLVVWREPATDGDTCYALVKADCIQALAKRLSLFVLRAKVKISIAARAVQAAVAPALPDSPAPWSLWRTSTQLCIRAPGADATQQRIWCVALEDSTTSTLCTDKAVQGEPHAEAWRAADIAAGLPWIGAANQDLYLAQTLNLDLIGAINFTKGCYPGQEVVARSHYRGTIKRRMAYGTAALDAQAQAGMDVYKTGYTDPCGRIINAAHTDACHLLLEIQLADLPSADFRLGDPAGAAITLHALPYHIVPDQAVKGG